MKKLQAGIAGAVALCAGMFVVVEKGRSQQPPAAAPQQAAPGAPGGRGRGGGFRHPDPIDFQDHAGWVQMFDGTTLAGWDADFTYWKVQDGSIFTESTCEKPTGTIYIVWQGGEAADFEMKFEMKGEGADVNGGLQYRGAIIRPGEGPARGGAPAGAAGGRGRGPQGPCPSGAPRGTPPSRESQARWDMLGAQFDFDGRNRYTGQFYEQATGRGIIAWRGEMVKTEQGKSPRLLAMLGNPDELAGYVKVDDFNQYHVIARGNTMTHIINGHVMSVLIDDDPMKFRKSGIIGFEIEGTGKLWMRNIWLKRL
ncbi:MAG TPA: DUF1080 domain-containing protein [Bryobacteraceae bacterium]|nr:DUF1080 domain-containing protein [Bryobacteraceae bacterium]